MVSTSTNIQNAYRTAKDFFSLSDDIKEKYEEKQGAKERGFIPFGIEHAKDNLSPDLKRVLANRSYIGQQPSEVSSVSQKCLAKCRSSRI